MAYLEKTTSGMSDGNKKIWTLSFWMKRTKLGSEQFLWSWGENNSSDGKLLFGAGDQLVFMNDGQCGSNQTMARALKDTNAWYHIVWRCKADEGSNDNRWKLYINGELIPASEYGSPSISNADGIVNKWSTQDCWHGGNARSQQTGSVNPFYGLMSHIHFCDGYAYDASDFGETDATTGEWKIKTSPSVSYGTNGYFILKDNNSGTDESPNSNSFTAVGTITKTQDNPSNFFATLSPHILPRSSGGTISNGSLTFGTSAAQWTTESSSFGITKGKYYFEVKLRDNGTDRRFRWGLQKNAEITKTGNNKVIAGTDNNAIGYATQGESATQGSYLINQSATTLSDGDINADNAIYGFAIDLDNQKMYGHFNGTWLHSGNPSAGSGGVDVSSFYTVGEPLFPSFTTHNSDIDINFGNGFFGTTAVATNSGSGYQDVDGTGIFNYTVPTNFRAICTKGINQ